MKLPTRSTRGRPPGRRGLWLASLALVAGQLLFVALVSLLAPSLEGKLAGGSLVAAGIVISVVPALIWLLFFYRQDVLEPEPKAYVFKVLALGALAAAAIGLPLVRDLFKLNQWLYANGLTHILGSILVVGFVQEFLVFACVRFSVFGSAEFDERADGIIYATAAALGLATVLNLDYVIGRGGVDLGVGAVRVTTAALAHAGIGGVMGYALGQAKFERRAAWYLPAVLLLAAGLNGAFFWLQDTVTLQGLSFNPFYGLIAAVAFAVILLGGVLWLMRRSNLETAALLLQAAEGGE